MSDTTLYDIEDAGRPVNKAFRTKQLFQCTACRACTNRARYHQTLAFSWMEIICRQRDKDWHMLIVAKMELARAPHPKSYLDELKTEIQSIRHENESAITDDVVGIDVEHTKAKEFNPSNKPF